MSLGDTGEVRVEGVPKKTGMGLPRAGEELVLSHPGGFPSHLSQPGRELWDPRGFPGIGRREVGDWKEQATLS